MRNAGPTAWLMAFVAVFLAEPSASGQTFRRAGTEFNAVRSVTVPAGRPYTVVVTEFWHQGEIQPDGRNLLVAAGAGQRVPVRVLQLGPGDFCRLAFQTLPGHSQYEIYYGGKPPTEKSPPWTCRDGLLLETRRFKPCNPYSRDSVRAAFDRAEPIGADYVDGVFHGFNPFSLDDKPFLSRYTGEMDLWKSDVYGLIVSSQDGGFLSLDDQLVTAAPGWHGPIHRVRPGTRRDMTLEAGLHAFQFDHVARGSRAVMVAAWIVHPTEDKPEVPKLLPKTLFHTHLIGRLPAGRLTLRNGRPAPDFIATLANEVWLPDNPVPLVGLLLRNTSSSALTAPGSKISWDFGDGQTSDLPIADHVYLRPGVYSVTLSIRRGAKTVSATNRIRVDRPRPDPAAWSYSFDDYLKILEDYDPKKLDGDSAQQLVLALLAQSDTLAARADEIIRHDQAQREDPNRRRRDTRPPAQPRETRQSEQYLIRAVEAGRSALTDGSAAGDDAATLRLAQLVGPLARWRLNDSQTALAVWQSAAQRMATAEAKSLCELAAADVAANDLMNPAEAKSLLDRVADRLGRSQGGSIGALWHRIEGDCAAMSGDGSSARDHYLEAERLSRSKESWAAESARRGAHARSTEEYLRAGQRTEAAKQLDAWQQAFPTEKIDGYLTLLWARYWVARGRYAQAVAQAEQLLTVNPDSPYADQALIVAADSQMRLGCKDRALAALHTLEKNYPGSPLAPLARQNIEALEKQDEKTGDESHESKADEP
ncbi:MAG: PKD domain-containing protein [Planctomycetaceae bacterium]|nr:PKD domain-containing protein [Planctomycetaceae bacterium]